MRFIASLDSKDSNFNYRALIIIIRKLDKISQVCIFVFISLGLIDKNSIFEINFFM